MIPDEEQAVEAEVKEGVPYRERVMKVARQIAEDIEAIQDEHDLSFTEAFIVLTCAANEINIGEGPALAYARRDFPAFK